MSPGHVGMSDLDWYLLQSQRRREAREARQARLLAARELGAHTDEQFYALCCFVDWHCVRCLAWCPDGLTRDHVVPLYRGGSDHIRNIQPLCRGCNSSKGVGDDTNWLLRRLGLEDER